MSAVFESGQKSRSRDLAQLLAGQNGTFLASRPGTTLVVVCQDSIKSLRASGSEYPTIPLGGGQTDTWEVEKINNATDIPEIADLRQARSQAQAQR